MKIIFHRPWVIVTRWRFAQWGLSIQRIPQKGDWRRHLRINVGNLSATVRLWR